MYRFLAGGGWSGKLQYRGWGRWFGTGEIDRTLERRGGVGGIGEIAGLGGDSGGGEMERRGGVHEACSSTHSSWFSPQ